MTALDDMRASVAASAPTKRGSKKVWVEPQPEDFAEGYVLAFDQTLTKTGWVDLEVRPGVGLGNGIFIHHGGVIETGAIVEGLKGFEETFAKAATFASQVTGVLEMFDLDLYTAVVHEMPAVRGYRIESSLMAAREVRRAAERQILNGESLTAEVAMINRQAVYGTLLGERHSEKTEMTRAVNRLIPNYCRNTTRWTQDVHDAAGLALKYLYDRKAR